MDLEIGKKVWIIEDSNPKEIEIRFIGNNEVAYELNGKLEIKNVSELYESEIAAKTRLEFYSMIVFCREVSRTTGEIAVYKVDANLTSDTKAILGLRSRMNPELIYGVCMKKFFDENQENMKNIEVLDKMVEKNNVILF